MRGKLKIFRITVYNLDYSHEPHDREVAAYEGAHEIEVAAYEGAHDRKVAAYEGAHNREVAAYGGAHDRRCYIGRRS